MDKSPLVRRDQRGFTLLETLFAVVILSVGVMALAALISKSSFETERARYMSLATQLASEKLEDLNRYPSADPVVAVTSGAAAGDLTSDSGPVLVTAGGVSKNVSYYDTVSLSSGDGAITEVIKGVDGAGSTQYTSTTQRPDGTNVSSISSTAPSLASALTFNRRWIIEADQPVAGARRITVLVSLQNGPGSTPVTFQMSMVRP